jgi:hypothetical protein
MDGGGDASSYEETMNRARSRIILLLVLLLALGWQRRAEGYALLTHEQLIDLTWQDAIVPLLLSRYPGLTAAELEQARAYAYGGCVIQDIGYYPFGDIFFSDLTHYVRSGDFVVSLFRNASNANELAFAVGALSHYIGDTAGHSLATNLAVPVEFPALRAKYGPVVNYAEGKHQHVRTEFAFDIDEVAHHRMAPVRYLRHIGLAVPVGQLALAFYQTYGLTEDFSHHRRRRFNVGEYRFAVRTFIPRIAYAVTLLHRNKEPANPGTAEAIALEREIAAMAAENHWDSYRRKAGIGTYALAGLLFILPKVGPLSLVAVKGPTSATEAEYAHSVTVSTNFLRLTLARFTPEAQRSAAENAAIAAAESHDAPSSGEQPGPLLSRDPVLSRDPLHPLPNRDLDTGRVVQPGGYPLTDFTYAELLHRIASHPDHPIPPGIKREIAAYYANPDLPIATKKDPQRWKQLQGDLKTLAAMPSSAEPKPYPTYGDDADDVQ